jgi:hypothetical protein
MYPNCALTEEFPHLQHVTHIRFVLYDTVALRIHEDALLCSKRCGNIAERRRSSALREIGTVSSSERQ